MLAILGLMGIALSAVMMVETDGDASTAGDGDTSPDTDDTMGVTPMNIIVYPDDYQVDDTESVGTLLADDLDQMSDLQTTLAGQASDPDTTEAAVEIDSGSVEAFSDNAPMNHQHGTDGDDRLFGRAGDDDLDGGAGDDILIGGGGSDQIDGGSGNDQIFAQDGYGDQLNGGAGDDEIYADHGDKMSGGAGDDVFTIIEDADAVVTDFDAEADRIEVQYEGASKPVLSTTLTDTGLQLLADGAVVATLGGITTLDLDTVALVAG